MLNSRGPALSLVGRLLDSVGEVCHVLFEVSNIVLGPQPAPGMGMARDHPIPVGDQRCDGSLTAPYDPVPGEELGQAGSVTKGETEMARDFFRRWTFVVQPRFQLALAGKLLLFLLVYAAIIVYVSLHSMAETMYILPLNCLTPEVKAQIWAFPTEPLLLSLLVALLVVLQIFLWSYRFAGPEFRLKRIIQEMAAGQYPRRVALRKDDFLKGLAESLVVLAQTLREHRQEDADRLAELQGKVEECTNHIRSGAPPGVVMAQLEALAQQIGSLKQGFAEADRPGADDQSSPVPAPQTVGSGSVPDSSGHTS